MEANITQDHSGYHQQHPTPPPTDPPTLSTPPSSALQPTPREDDDTRRKIIAIIDHQFDLEIFLKHRELASIQEEIAKAEETLQDLRIAIVNEIVHPIPDYQHNTRRARLHNGAFHTSTFAATGAGAGPSSSTNTHKLSVGNGKQNGKTHTTRAHVFARRADGMFVRLSCPRCKKNDFANRQGFVNHCRLAHALEFANYEETVRICGIPVDESEVPLDHSSRYRPVTKPEIMNGNGSSSNVLKQVVPRPTIKEFDEEVDLDDDASRPHAGDPSSSVPRHAVSPKRPRPPRPSSSLASTTSSHSSSGSSASSDSDSDVQRASRSSASSRRRSRVSSSSSRSASNAGSRSDSDSGSGSSSSSSSSSSPRQSLPRQSSPRQSPPLYTDGRGTIADGGMNVDEEEEGSELEVVGKRQGDEQQGDEQQRERERAKESEDDSLSVWGDSEESGIAKVPERQEVGVEAEVPEACLATSVVGALAKPASDEPIGSLVAARESTPPATPEMEKAAMENMEARAMVGGGLTAMTGKLATVASELATVAVPQTGRVEDDDGSRFYVKRRVVIGNVSKFVPTEKRDPHLLDFTHKWMVYVVSPPNTPDIATFVSRVRFHLHPSYRPHDMIDVTRPPFHLTRYGWGEFPLRIQMFFADRRNKPVDVIHILRLDNTHSGRQLLGGERSFDIELDRNTEFLDPVVVPANTPAKTGGGKERNHRRQGGKVGEVIDLALGDTEAREAGKEEEDPMEKMLLEGTEKYPVVRGPSRSDSSPELPYTCAPSVKAYLDWNIGHRKAVEWHRARLVRLGVQRLAAMHPDPRLRAAAPLLTTRFVVRWARDNGHTPIRPSASVTPPPAPSLPEIAAQQTYCKACGCPRVWHEEGAGPVEARCGRRPKDKKGSGKKNGNGVERVYGATSTAEMLRKEMGDGWDVEAEAEAGKRGFADVDMDIDVDFGTTTARTGLLREGRARTRGTAEAAREAILGSLNSVEAEIVDDRGVDWVWEVVDKIKLSGVVATEMVGAGGVAGGRGRGGETQEEMVEVLEQRVVTGSVLFQATRAFLRSVLQSSVSVYRAEQATDPTPQTASGGEGMEVDHGPAAETKAEIVAANGARRRGKLMVPYHVYQALQANPERFDFLTNQC